MTPDRLRMPIWLIQCSFSPPTPWERDVATACLYQIEFVNYQLQIEAIFFLFTASKWIY